MKRKQEGITLIALVVSIIVLLILAGVVIVMILNDNGVLGKAKEGKEEYSKAAIKEEIEIAIVDIKVDEVAKGKFPDIKLLVERLPSKLFEIVIEQQEEEAVGEYKGYSYYIDTNHKVIIGDRVQGEKPEIKYEILNKDKTFGKIRIKVIAQVTGGKIKTIENVSGATQISNLDNKEKVYEVLQNGDYTFWAQSDVGRKCMSSIKVDNILETPKISIDQIETESFMICVTNNYKDNEINKYQYWVNDTLKGDNIKENQYKTTQLTDGTNYKVKVRAYAIDGTYKDSDVIEIITKMKVKVGDFVNYDAGVWTETKPKPVNWGEFGGYEKDSSKNNSVEVEGNKCTYNGWRIYEINTDQTIKSIIHAGCPELFYHANGYADSSISCFSNRDWSYYVNSNKYADSAYLLGNPYVSGEIAKTGTGANYWINSRYSTNAIYYIYGKSGGNQVAATAAFGIRPVIKMQEGVKVVNPHTEDRGADGTTRNVIVYELSK